MLFALATFPGILVHEWAHKKSCDYFGIRVHDVAYLNIKGLFNSKSEPLGYVCHSASSSRSYTFWISFSPLIVNSILAIAFGYIAANLTKNFTVILILYWLGLSVGIHAFPSYQDAQNVLQQDRLRLGNKESIIQYWYYFLFSLIWTLNGFRRWWIDLIYSVALVSFGARL